MDSSNESMGTLHQQQQQQLHQSMQPSEAYPQHQHPQHDSLTNFMDSSNAITPTTYLANAGFGGPSAGSQRPTSTLVTNLDRSGPQFKVDEGEETPIGRIVNSFGAGPSSMDAKNSAADAAARQRAQQQMAAAVGWPQSPNAMGAGTSDLMQQPRS